MLESILCWKAKKGREHGFPTDQWRSVLYGNAKDLIPHIMAFCGRIEKKSAQRDFPESSEEGFNFLIWRAILQMEIEIANYIAILFRTI